MTNQLSFKIKKTPEALERVLRVIRQRCFRVYDMNVETNDNLYIVKLSVTSERDIKLLENQLVKLIGLSDLKNK